MNVMNQVWTLDEAICISLHAHALVKEMHQIMENICAD